MNLLTPGMRLMLLGTFLFSIGSLLVKVAGVRLPSMEILFVRGVVGVALCWYILRRAGAGMFGQRKFLLFMRGLLGFAALFAEFYTIVHLPLADALVLLFSHPMVVALFAWILLGEKLSVGALLSILATLAGVLLVCRPAMLFGTATASLDPVALAVAFAAIILISAAVLTVRALAKTEHPAVVMVYPPLFIALFAPLFAEGWLMPTPEEWLAVLGVALFMNAGQYYMTKGYAIESAARISGVSCLEIVFAATWGMMFLGEVPDMWTIGGGALIVFGVLLLGRSGLKERASESVAG
jgi:drug/metabolite transporter (DMT)-like permease